MAKKERAKVQQRLTAAKMEVERVRLVNDKKADVKAEMEEEAKKAAEKATVKEEARREVAAERAASSDQEESESAKLEPMLSKEELAESYPIDIIRVSIGVVAILSTAVAEKLSKKNYAMTASNLERIRVDYQGVADLLKSEMAFPKEEAINLETRVRRVIQDLNAGHIAHQPPPEIKEMFGLMRMRRN